MSERLSLGAVDVAVVLLFAVAILALGFSAKLRDSSVLQYLAAGRALSLPAFVATLVSTWYGGILGVAESVQLYGIGAWTLIGLPYYVFAAIYGLVLAQRVRQAEQISIPERLALRWGRAAGVLGAVLVFLLAVPAAHVLMLGVLTQLLTGLDRGAAVILAALVGTLFLYKGGLLADVRASLLAFAAMYIGFAAMLSWCVLHHPLQTMWANLDSSLKKFDGGGGIVQTLSFFILGAWTFVDPGFHQRVASASSPAVSRRGVLISVLAWMVFDLLSIGTALYAVTMLNPAPPALEIFPRFGDQVLPTGLKGIFLCGMLGTILIAMVGHALVSGATFGREIVSLLSGVGSDERVKSWTRVGIAVSTMVAIGLAMSLNSVVALWYSWAGAVVGALLIPVTISYLASKPVVSSGWIIGAMSIAFAASMAWLIYGQLTENLFLEVALSRSDRGWSFELPPFEGDRETMRFGLGTLAPGLVISALVLAVGRIASRGRAHE